MDKRHFANILKELKATNILHIEQIQPLWSNFGSLVRLSLDSNKGPFCVIAKTIQTPKTIKHPKGFNSEESLKRKIKSYQVEINWYQGLNKINLKDDRSKTAKLLAYENNHDHEIIILEDLTHQNFQPIKNDLSLDVVESIIIWLANFHSKFIGVRPVDLWEQGTYWHLETRQEELKKLEDSSLKIYAPFFNQALKQAKYQTILHGDAKKDNFLYCSDGQQAAAVDFQYCGKGCGIKDVIYFLSSCLEQLDLIKYEDHLLNFYFNQLKKNLKDNQVDFYSLETEWRELYLVAWADFIRFLKGWSPDHWKLKLIPQKYVNQAKNQIQAEITKTCQMAATKASQNILSYFHQPIEISHKEENGRSPTLVTEADVSSQKIILNALAPLTKKYNIGILAEESIDDQSRLTKDYFWAIDPMDGTDFFAKGHSGFAVSLALVANNGKTLFALVSDPLEQSSYIAGFDLTAEKNFKKYKQTPLNHKSPLTIFADRSLQKSPYFEQLKNEFDIKFNGSAVSNCISVLKDENACYLKFPKKEIGGCAIWDLAACDLIIKKSGGWISSFAGKPLNFNNPDTVYFNHLGLVVCKSENHFHHIKNILNQII